MRQRALCLGGLWAAKKDGGVLDGAVRLQVRFKLKFGLKKCIMSAHYPKCSAD